MITKSEGFSGVFPDHAAIVRGLDTGLHILTAGSESISYIVHRGVYNYFRI